MNLSLLLHITLFLAINLKKCHGYFSDYEENKCSHIIEQRIVNLEEPVWAITYDNNRWNKCNDNEECNCLEIKKFLFCNINGSLNRNVQIPWDTETLELRDSHLDGLSNTAFNNFPRLQELVMNGVGLKHISRHTFDHLTNLKHLSLSRNELYQFDEKLFWKLHHLEKLDLSMNKMEKIPENTFIYMDNLTYLHLDWNNITSISKYTFEGLSNLKYLYMIRNLLTKIEEGSMNHFMGLESLSFSQNFLKDISFLNSNKLTTLIELNLSQNKISQLRKEYFQYLHGLSVLNLEDNLLQEFNFGIIPPNLETLNLHKNYITTLMPSTVPLKLIYLELSGNNIEYLPREVFRNLKNLEYLTLSNNMLTNFDYYSQLPQSLKKLDLRSNLIQTLQSDAGKLTDFRDLLNLTELFLSQNQWECSCNWNQIHKNILQDWNSIDCLDSNDNFVLINDFIKTNC